MGRTIFVGDVHGCAAEFSRILETVGFDAGEDRLLLTGDAFTKGPDPMGVWRLIEETGAEMVMGNHDLALIDRLEIRLRGEEGKMKTEHKKTLDALTPEADTLLPWLHRLPYYIDEEAFLLVHAGINPERELRGTSRDEFVAIRTWPPVKGIEGPRWHDVYEPIRPLIAFGHDAPGGLVVKRHENGEIYVLGLDSGCVYGNQLSAYVLEERCIVQVENQTSAFPVGG